MTFRDAVENIAFNLADRTIEPKNAAEAIIHEVLSRLPEKIERFDKSDPILWGEAYTRIDNAKADGFNAALAAVRERLGG